MNHGLSYWVNLILIIIFCLIGGPYARQLVRLHILDLKMMTGEFTPEQREIEWYKMGLKKL